MTFLTVAMTAMTLLFAPVADEAECQFGTVSGMNDALSTQAVTARGLLSSQELAQLEEKAGPPPGVEGAYTVLRVDVPEGASFLFIIQGECVNQRAGPLRTERLNTLLGITSARRPQGERID